MKILSHWFPSVERFSVLSTENWTFKRKSGSLQSLWLNKCSCNPGGVCKFASEDKSSFNKRSLDAFAPLISSFIDSLAIKSQEQKKLFSILALNPNMMTGLVSGTDTLSAQIRLCYPKPPCIREGLDQKNEEI